MRWTYPDHELVVKTVILTDQTVAHCEAKD